MNRKRKRELRELTREYFAQMITNHDEMLNERFDSLTEDELAYVTAERLAIATRIDPEAV